MLFGSAEAPQAVSLINYEPGRAEFNRDPHLKNQNQNQNLVMNAAKKKNHSESLFFHHGLVGRERFG